MSETLPFVATQGLGVEEILRNAFSIISRESPYTLQGDIIISFLNTRKPILQVLGISRQGHLLEAKPASRPGPTDLKAIL